MERELWPRLYHLVMEVGNHAAHRRDFSTSWIVLWSCSGRPSTTAPCAGPAMSGIGRTTTLRPARFPARRPSVVVSVAWTPRCSCDPGGEIRAEGDDLDRGDRRQAAARRRRQRGPRGPLRPRRRHVAKGYKLFAIWDGRPAPEVYRVHPMNKSEDKVAEEMISEAAAAVATCWATASTTPTRSTTRPGRRAIKSWLRARTRRRGWGTTTRARTACGAST